MKFSLIVPMYNECEVIQDTVRTLNACLGEQFGADFELLFVDDGSSDGSAALVEALKLPQVRVLRYEPNRGKGCAVRTGMLAAVGELRMFLDADLAYGTAVIAQAVDLLEQHPERDILIGSRVKHAEGYSGYTWLRKTASKAYIGVLNVTGGLKQSDSQCGCKLFRARAAQEIFSRMECDGFAFDFEAILWAQKLGFGIVELPVKIINHRQSKVRVFHDAVQMLGELRRIKKRVKNGA